MILQAPDQTKNLTSRYWELANLDGQEIHLIRVVFTHANNTINANKKHTVKKYLIIMSALAFMAACGGKEEKKTETAASNNTEDLSSNPDYQKGLELIGQSDCLTCHKVGDKLIGPSYREVAAKYDNTEENITMLAGKIIKGGQGVWGSVPMTAHPNISEADAKAMVKYIFLLKK
jgi:cytochrome c